jgi:HlyD family secretion protein
MNLTSLHQRATFGALAALMLLGVGYVLTRTGPLAPTRITITKVEQGTLTPELFGVGTLEARRAWRMAPTVTGRVKAVHVDVGDTVKAGQLLAEMDPVDMQERLAALDAAAAKADSLQSASAAQTADAAARHQTAKANLKRNEDLARQQFISPAALDARQQELSSAQAVLRSAQSLAVASQQERQRLQAERASLLKQLSNLRLIATASGVVASREAEPGATVLAGQTVIQLVDPASLRVRTRLDQGQSQGLQVGLAARVLFRSRPQAPVSGRVDRLERLADSVTEERTAQVRLDTLPADWAVGEMAEVTLQLPPTAQGLVVPAASVQTWQGQTGLWHLTPEGLRFIPVQALASSPQGRVQVRAAPGPQGSRPTLRAGDEVVVYSQRALAPGQKVRVVDSLQPDGARP